MPSKLNWLSETELAQLHTIGQVLRFGHYVGHMAHHRTMGSESELARLLCFLVSVCLKFILKEHTRRNWGEGAVLATRPSPPPQTWWLEGEGVGFAKKNTNFGKRKRDGCFPVVSDKLSSMVHEKSISRTFRGC